jgi:DNA-binding IclR family transcriptional regulator
VNDNSPPSYPIESVGRALRLLSSFQTRSTLSLADAATELGITKSSAHRLLAMFLWHGYLRQDPSAKDYRVGHHLLELSLAVLRQAGPAEGAMAFAQELAERFGETVHIAVLNGRDASYIDGIESARTLRAGLRVGTSLPAHVTATGKALLAQLPPEQVLRLFPDESLASTTDRSVSRRADLIAQLEEVRERGFAVNAGESEPGLTAVSVALPDSPGGVLTAVAIAFPTVRSTESVIAEMGRFMVQRLENGLD